jgi:hypothetical protein
MTTSISYTLYIKGYQGFSLSSPPRRAKKQHSLLACSRPTDGEPYPPSSAMICIRLAQPTGYSRSAMHHWQALRILTHPLHMLFQTPSRTFPPPLSQRVPLPQRGAGKAVRVIFSSPLPDRVANAYPSCPITSTSPFFSCRPSRSLDHRRLGQGAAQKPRAGDRHLRAPVRR